MAVSGAIFRNTWLSLRQWETSIYIQERWWWGHGEIRSMCVLRFLSERTVSASFLKIVVKQLFPGHLVCARDYSKFSAAIDLLPQKWGTWSIFWEGDCIRGNIPSNSAPVIIWKRCFQSEKGDSPTGNALHNYWEQHSIALEMFLCKRPNDLYPSLGITARLRPTNYVESTPLPHSRVLQHMILESRC